MIQDYQVSQKSLQRLVIQRACLMHYLKWKRLKLSWWSLCKTMGWSSTWSYIQPSLRPEITLETFERENVRKLRIIGHVWQCMFITYLLTWCWLTKFSRICSFIAKSWFKLIEDGAYLQKGDFKWLTSIKYGSTFCKTHVDDSTL